MKHNFYSCGRYLIYKATRISRKQMIACCVLAFSTLNSQFSISAQDTVRRLDEVIIQDVRVSNKTPLTTSTMNREQLDEARSAVSLPFMLETQPSVVASGENGGVGATALRIRGVDGSRINVNINGITLNDPESQEVFWYNIPNLGGMAQSMQIQRGVGASNGGSPAFGAAINMQTLNAQNHPYGEADLGFGSWNTRQYSFSAGTGILKNGLSFDFTYSGLTSDGYIRSWGTDQQSFFGSVSWYGERTLISSPSSAARPPASPGTAPTTTNSTPTPPTTPPAPTPWTAKPSTTPTRPTTTGSATTSSMSRTSSPTTGASTPPSISPTATATTSR